MRAIPFSLRYSQSHLLLSLRHINNTSLPLFPPISNPNFLPSFSNTRIYTQTKAKKAETGNGNNSLPAFDPDPSLSQQKLLQVVLVSPQIPGNAGCIARTCAASAVALHLVGPLGFKVDDTKLKRAGLDYWPYVVVRIHDTWAEFQNYFKQQEGNKRLLAFTKRGTTIHSDFSYRKGDYLVFGSETCGLPPDVLLDCKSETYGDGTIRIPMVETHVRSLNLSVSVDIALYEASRQMNYEQLQEPRGNCSDREQSYLTEDIFA
ncbi:putative tRNA (cytidine(34)-2'-O)-methyltransferase [Hibiscus syriacus]|uniref:putative tRNA (cytidine(34)-2'-O)-methyltransferase n=1 Tax=Hibiscus syriacus TaxID=106335 RepID=UPI001924FE85|nr:putative tRNA (cytidine(34)-2'-O)-methyltransferase [Hibiscus syriacus]